jgi:DNA-binding LytR/AlgR family response regulator
MKVAIKSAHVLRFVNSDEILYLKAKGSYCLIKQINGEEIKVSKNLLNLGSLFGQCINLVKCHRGYVVNITQVNSIQYAKNQKSNIILSNNDTIPLSNIHKKNFIDKIKEQFS